MRLVAGIDVGSGATKAVVMRAWDEAAEVAGRGLVRTGVQLDKAAREALQAAAESAGVAPGDVSYVATTGFGRYSVSFRDIQVTEITSAARGARHLLPSATAVLDIGSQSTRALTLNQQGKVRLFKTNDKCAAGSGSFIVRAAKYLQVPLEDVGSIAVRASNPQPISSICAVLAESEIINHVSAGVSVEDILRGIYDSLAERASLLLKRAGWAGGLVFIGGVARQAGMVKALEARLGGPVEVPPHAEYVCATGAALLGWQRMRAVAAAQPAPSSAVASD